MFTMLADSALKGFALLAVVAFLGLTCRRASASARHLVWLLGVVGLLVLPLLSAALPSWRVQFWPGWLTPDAAVPTAAVAEPLPAAAPPPADLHNAPLGPDSPSARLESPPQVAAHDAPPLPSAWATTPTGRWTVGWSSAWLVALWVTVALLAILPTLVGLGQLARLRRLAKPVRDEAWQKLLKQVAYELKLGRSVQLLASHSAAMPLTFGAVRPVLLLPADSGNWSADRRRLVLLHELAHVRRIDWPTQLLAQTACALHWFNPLAWLAARQMQALREQACDDLVLACGAKPSDYAEQLLAIAARQHERPFLALAAVPMARRSALEIRLRAVLDSHRNRAALTAVTAAVAVSLLAMVLVPLAMLQAAGPKPADTPPAADVAPQPTIDAQTVAPRDPTPAELAARQDGIRISVLSATGDQGIREFRVLAGVPSRGITDEFSQRTGREVVNWQPHTLQIGNDGEFVWPLQRAYDEMALRVEADGYIPQMTGWLKKATGRQHVVFKLVRDPEVKGTILRPDGRPAAGATVALALAQRDAVWVDGRIRGTDKPLPEKLSDRWRLPIVRTTDADGHFQLPTEPEVAALLIVHDAGVRELTYSQFQKSPEITLQRWGCIEGQVLWGNKPGANEPVSLISHRDEYGYPGMIAAYADTQSDAEGRFVFDRVLPGQVQISRPIRVSPTDPQAGSHNFAGLVQHVPVQAGDPTAMILGGQGRKITGRLVGRDSWQGVTFHFHPVAPHIGFPGDDESWKAFGVFRTSTFGRHYFRDQQPVRADGSFVIDNLLPGAYQLFFYAPGANQHVAYYQLRVEPEVPGQPPATMELGAIQVTAPQPQAALDEFLSRVRESRRGLFAGNPIATDDQGQIVGLSLAEFQLRPDDARVIGQLSHLRSLSLQRSNVQDQDLREWSALKQLKRLNLWDAKLSDAGIAALVPLGALESLQLGGTGITDAGLTSVARLTALRDLDLARTKVTDKGLNQLSTLKQLAALKLAETAVSDQGLEALDQLPALRGVTLDETRVTAAGITRLSNRAGFAWIRTEQDVADELARRLTAGDTAGVEAMLSIGVELPRTGTFKTRSVTAHPVTPKDTERQRKRFRVEWDWNHDGKPEGLFAEVAVRQGSPRLIEVGLLEADAQAPAKADAPAKVDVPAKAEAKAVTIRGTVVDDQTGKAVGPLVVQAGKFDPADPTRITWGYSEQRSSARDGSFSATVRWAEGWTARILADGYVPQPVLDQAPPAGKSEIELVVRMKRGRVVRGLVLDAKNQPAAGVAVFAIGPTGLNLAGGKALTTWGEPNPVAKATITDDAGRFELAAGEAQRLAVSGGPIDAWPAAIADQGETVIRLPEPARVEIRLDIAGAAKDSQVFFQLLGDVTPGFQGLSCEHTRTIANGGTLTLPALPPGKYQFCRQVMNNLGEIGIGAMLERQFIELKGGQSLTISYERPRGARVKGKVVIPAGVKLMGTVVAIVADKSEKSPFDEHSWTTTYASHTTDADGTFLTERIAPGTYLLQAEAYVPLTPEQRVRSGIIGPSYTAQAKIVVPESGELVVPDLALTSVR